MRERSPWKVAADRVDPRVPEVAERYWSDPVGFVREVVGVPPADYQARILRGLVERFRVAVRAPHGPGKTAVAAWAVLWFASTREAAGRDWKAPTTASVWRQLDRYLWPEIHKWARQMDWARLDRGAWSARELQTLALVLEHGSAFAVTSDDPAHIEGAHAESVLYVFDEAKSIPAETFDAAEGALAAAGDDTGAEAFALATSTPGGPSGRFYAIHARTPGLEDWTVERVTIGEAVEAGRVAREWVEARRRQWGSTSAVFRNRVLGEFASDGEDGVIPLEWVEVANARWLDEHPDCGWSSGGHDGRGCGLDALTSVGVDVARSGADETVIALRRGDTLAELRHSKHEDTMQTAGRVLGVVRAYGGVPVVDVVGVGAGVVDKLRADGVRVVAYNASEGTVMTDASGELGFVNARAAGWWRLRELLDPGSGRVLVLPPDDRLVGDLTAPRWRVAAGGRIQVEAKDEIRRRLGRSTDDGDAVVMAWWLDARPAQEMTVSVPRGRISDARRRVSTTEQGRGSISQGRLPRPPAVSPPGARGPHPDDRGYPPGVAWALRGRWRR